MSQFYYLNDEILGSCHLAVGERNTVLFDPGMAWYGEKTVEKIKEIIGDRPIDAVFLTHSHYDHVGALPVIKKYWPDAMVFGAAYAGRVFSKLSAKRLIRELSASAAQLNGTALPDDYSTRAIQLDQMLIGGETINVGDVCVQSIKTVGHTKDCLSYPKACHSRFTLICRLCAYRANRPAPSFSLLSVRQFYCCAVCILFFISTFGVPFIRTGSA